MLTLWLGCASFSGTDAVVSAKTDTAVPERMPLCINEFMPSNNVALLRPDGSSPDWIELHNPGDEDISLDGWGITDDVDKPHKHAFDPAWVVPARGYLLLFATGEPETGDRHLGFKLAQTGGSVALFSPLLDGQVVNYGTVERDFSVHRTSDCCQGDDCLDFAFRGTPGFNNLATQGASDTFVFSGSDWTWSNTLHAGWTQVGFDDSGWSTATAPVGFGDTHIVGTIDGGAEGARVPAVFLRRSFTVTDADQVTALRAELMVDDAARVYLNGVEVLSENLPAGATETSWAANAVGPPLETLVVPFWFDVGTLVEGENVVAVEVHQAAATSSDLTFDLTLVASRQ